jgi:ATP-dependent Lon protease
MNTKSKKAYATQISDAQVMTAGLNANLDLLQQRGMTAEFVGKLQKDVDYAIEQNNAQEKLKADLKAATAALDKTLGEVNKAMSEATKVVKLQMPQEQWKEFGIQAKK